MSHDAPVGPAVALPKASLAGTGRVAWSVAVGYVLLVCRVVAVVAIGVVLNWGFLALAAWKFGPTSRGLPIGITILIVLGVLFPLGYFVVGQKQGVQVLLRHCYQRHQSSLFDFLLLLLQRVVGATGNSRSPISADTIRSVLRRVDEMPWPVRFALNHYLRHQEFQKLALEIVSDENFRSGNLAATRERYATRVNDCILTTMLTVDNKWFWILSAVNAIAMAVVWLLVS